MTPFGKLLLALLGAAVLSFLTTVLSVKYVLKRKARKEHEL